MKKVMLTQKNRLNLNIQDKELLILLSSYCSRLYNVGLYNVRQHYFNNNKKLSYVENYHLSKENDNYKLLLTDCGGQILRIVDRNINSFIGLLKLKNKGKYSEKVHLPHYKKQDELSLICIYGRSARIKDGYVYVGFSSFFKERHNLDSYKLKFKLPKHLEFLTELRELRIIPKYNGKEFEIEFVYEKEVQEQKDLNYNSYLSLDLGIDNFLACTNPTNELSFLIDGKYIKSVNHWYNKEKARLQTIYTKSKVSYHTNKTIRLEQKRYFRINNYFNLVVNYLVKTCIKYKIGTIVVGDWHDIKRKVKLGKINNQNFIQIPYGKFKQKLESKCEQIGIKVEYQDESYTSKCSFLDQEYPEYRNNYLGKRIKRGLFQTSKGSCINADINGSLNILVKYLKSKELLLNEIYQQLFYKDVVNHPIRIKIL